MIIRFFLLSFFVAFPSLAHASWLYVPDDGTVRKLAVLTAAGWNNTQSSNLLLTTNTSFFFDVTNTNKSANIIQTTSTAFPAPVGYGGGGFDQAYVDAAVAAALAAAPASTTPATMTFPFNVALYAQLIGWFLGLVVLSFGAGSVYRLFTQNRYG